jgi:hypothetical protein
MSSFILITNSLAILIAINEIMTSAGIYTTQPYIEFFIYRVLEFLLLLTLIVLVEFRSESRKKSKNMAIIRILSRKILGKYSDESENHSSSFDTRNKEEPDHNSINYV